MAQALSTEDIDNAHIVNGLARARLAAERLMKRGVVVNEIQVLNYQAPLIRIENDDVVCAALPPGTLVFKRGEKIFESPFEGCRVQWRKPT